MDFSLLTYNVLFNKAFLKIEDILAVEKPDILCLQEVDTNEKNLARLEKFGYKLADYSNSSVQFGKIFGIATYYNLKTVKLTKIYSFNLPKSLFEVIMTIIKFLKGGNKPRTILRTDFKLEKKILLSVYNIHLSLQGTNHTRTKQLKTVLNHSLKLKNRPVLITGDFNYFPYGRKGLENLMKKYGFKEATKKIYYTVRYPERKFARYSFFQELVVKLVRRFFSKKIKIDYIYYKNLQLINSKRINKELSDHYPVISTFRT